MGVPGGGAARLRWPAPPRRPLHRWRGKITTDTPRQGAEYVAALVVTDLATEWKVNGICEQHAPVIV
ncbi:hypothetical protein [Streptomyces sp. NPDC052107]|uniref:hypothetical protein n=1 Tax=Streptomyces sp. NPDC052107 TaxID=3155632 RepID=UPI0034159B3B